MGASPNVAVRSAVATGLAALADLKGVEVGFGWKQGSKHRERIYTDRTQGTQASAAMKAGRNFRNETGTFDLVIWVEGPGKDAAWVATRANALRQICEDWISDRKNNELDIEGLQTLTVEGEWSATEGFADSGSLAEVRIPVQYTARIT